MINKELALKYCGMEEIFKRATLRFLNLYSDFEEKLKNSNNKLALIHQLKGITLNLGAIKLYDISLNVEKNLNLLDEYLIIFNKTYDELKKMSILF